MRCRLVLTFPELEITSIFTHTRKHHGGSVHVYDLLAAVLPGTCIGHEKTSKRRNFNNFRAVSSHSFALERSVFRARA
jgi:hypothetical protein